MADERNFNNDIHACALGCMDKEEYIDLIEFIEGGGNFNWGELGEYQNLAALLPSFLNIETPDSSVKSMVAQRLYKLKEEKKLASTPANKQPAPAQPASAAVPAPAANIPSPAEPPAASGAQPFSRGGAGRPPQNTQISLRSQEPVSHPRADDSGQNFRLNIPSEIETPDKSPKQEPESAGISLNFSAIEEQLHPDEQETSAPEPQPPVYIPEPTPSAPEQDTYIHDETPAVEHTQREEHRTAVVPEVQTAVSEQPIIIKKGISAYIFIPLILILLGAIAGVYYMMQQNVEAVKSGIASEVTKQTEPLNEQLLRLNKQQEVITLLQQPDVIYADLKPSTGSEGLGKLIFSPSLQKGQLHLTNLRIIPPADQKVYQLWLTGRKTSLFVNINYSVSVSDFIPVNLAGDLSKERTLNVLVTREKVGTTPASPSREVELSGTISLR